MHACFFDKERPNLHQLCEPKHKIMSTVALVPNKEPHMGFAVTGVLAHEIKRKVVQGMQHASKKRLITLPDQFQFEYKKKEKRLGN